MIKIEVNIFTNCTVNAPSVDIIKKTLRSFQNTFGEYPVRCFADPNPNNQKFPAYKKKLSKIFKEIHEVSSLSEGYIQSVEMSDADFLFQLEHDWIFNDNINHALPEIAFAMIKKNIYHLRFNKRENIAAVWDKTLEESESNGIKYCITPQLSNNPHIIDRIQYMELIERIEIKPGSKGIEEVLSWKDLKGAIYGPLNYPATVTHIDGRH